MAFIGKPRIVFAGTASVFADQILDNATSYSEPRKGSVVSQAESGIEDAWTLGTDYYFEADWRFIPTTSPTFPVSAGTAPFLTTGWDGAAGFRAFLEHVRDKFTFFFFPDGTNLLQSPTLQTDNGVGVPVDWSFNAHGTNTTSSIDLTVGAAKINVVAGDPTNPRTPNYLQFQYDLIPNLGFTASVDCMTSGTTANTYALLTATVEDITGSVVVNVSSSNYTGTSFTRLAVSGTTPSQPQFVIISLQMVVSASSHCSGVVWFRNANMVQWPNTGTSFVSGNYVRCTLVDPMNGVPTIEENGMRSVHLKLRSTSSTFDGY